MSSPLVEVQPENSRIAPAAQRALLIVPHPDDESYGGAGSLARLGADPDTSVSMLFLTSGEAATIGKERGIPPDELATMREGRCARVRDRLGLDRLFFARLPDGRLSHRPIDELVTAIDAALETTDPHVVVGHDPRGVNAHPDHIASHWGIRTSLRANARSVVRWVQFAHDQESVEAAAPRLLFATPEDRIHCSITFDEREAALKEACLLEHEAVVTILPEVAEAEGKILRPPREDWEFFGEAPGASFAGWFDRLPERLASL